MVNKTKKKKRLLTSIFLLTSFSTNSSGAEITVLFTGCSKLLEPEKEVLAECFTSKHVHSEFSLQVFRRPIGSSL